MQSKDWISTQIPKLTICSTYEMVSINSSECTRFHLSLKDYILTKISFQDCALNKMQKLLDIVKGKTKNTMYITNYIIERTIDDPHLLF